MTGHNNHFSFSFSFEISLLLLFLSFSSHDSYRKLDVMMDTANIEEEEKTPL